MKTSQKVGAYVLAGGIVTFMQVGKRYCNVKAKQGKSKFYKVMDQSFDIAGEFVENVLAVCMVVGMFI